VRRLPNAHPSLPPLCSQTLLTLFRSRAEEYPHSPANSPDPSPPPSSASEVAQYLQLLSSLSPPPAIPPRPLSLQTTVNSLLLSPHPSLTTSTPLRLRFLTSLYEPLLASLFAVKTVQETLAATGLDAKNVQTSLAEFVLALSTANLNALESSGINKLTSLLSLGSPPGPLRRLEPFLAVILACSRPAACLALACLAMDAVKRAAATREQKTLGLELAANETDVWSDMIERGERKRCPERCTSCHSFARAPFVHTCVCKTLTLSSQFARGRRSLPDYL